MVLPPHEDTAPVRQVVRHDGQPVPPRLHHRLHVVQAVVPAQVGGLEAGVNLCRFLKFDDLLGCLNGTRIRDPMVSAREENQPGSIGNLKTTKVSRRTSRRKHSRSSLSFTLCPKLCSCDPPTSQGSALWLLQRRRGRTVAQVAHSANRSLQTLSHSFCHHLSRGLLPRAQSRTVRPACPQALFPPTLRPRGPHTVWVIPLGWRICLPAHPLGDCLVHHLQHPRRTVGSKRTGRDAQSIQEPARFHSLPRRILPFLNPAFPLCPVSLWYEAVLLLAVPSPASCSSGANLCSELVRISRTQHLDPPLATLLTDLNWRYSLQGPPLSGRTSSSVHYLQLSETSLSPVPPDPAGGNH